MALTYPKKYKEDINPKTQNKDIDPANAEQKDLNGFLLYHIVYYINSEYNNTMLQYYMKEDFVGWTKEIQALANKLII